MTNYIQLDYDQFADHDGDATGSEQASILQTCLQMDL